MDAFTTLPLSPVRTRVVMACTHCRKRKIKCLTVGANAEGPCERCTKRGLKCEFIAVAGQRHEDPESPAAGTQLTPGLDRLAAPRTANPERERQSLDMHLPSATPASLYSPMLQGASVPVPSEYSPARFSRNTLGESSIYPTPDPSQFYIRSGPGPSPGFDLGSLPPLTRLGFTYAGEPIAPDTRQVESVF